ncbi:unnamed protein product [Thelazia callipaeda]|uniref:F-box domain-containing protein n=1 Tax=Thelazia callipaeda TaxID=103827 RepID=A0A158RAP9_THECL|nr:unnamed protein product [Thelazia callipaeda]
MDKLSGNEDTIPEDVTEDAFFFKASSNSSFKENFVKFDVTAVINCLPKPEECMSVDVSKKMRWHSPHLGHFAHSGCSASDDGKDEYTFHDMPDLVMECIFRSLNLRDRCIASQVLKCYCVDTVDQLLIALLHCRIINSVKIWFADSIFAERILRKLKQAKVRMRCLDLYPYGTEKALKEAFSFFPELTGMTMRPHGQQFFWSGLNMDWFPTFSKLDTLLLDGFNIRPEVSLPQSLTTLEWLNRSGNFSHVIPKLSSLVNLEYLMLGHAEFLLPDEFDSFLQVISSENIPKLQYLVFRYCKIQLNHTPDAFYKSSSNTGRNVFGSNIEAVAKLNSLQILKLDLCNLDLDLTVRRIIAHTGSAMRVVSVNVISEETNCEKIYHLSSLIAEKKLSLHFGLLQKDMRDASNRRISWKSPPASFGSVLARFEASFVTDASLLKTLLLTHPLPQLTDLKFIQVSSITSQILQHISLTAVLLRKLSIINCCEDELDVGISQLIFGFQNILSKSLQVIWKRKLNQSYSLYDTLIKDRLSFIKPFKIHIIRKKFAANRQGEKIVIWESETGRSMHLQDFDSNDQGRILGILMPPDCDLQFMEGNGCTSSVQF